jgi:hypothetical protein
MVETRSTKSKNKAHLTLDCGISGRRKSNEKKKEEEGQGQGQLLVQSEKTPIQQKMESKACSVASIVIYSVIISPFVYFAINGTDNLFGP